MAKKLTAQLKFFQIVLLCASSVLLSKNVTRFRGENGQGIYASSNAPVTWSKQDIAWSLKLPGRGHSSPVVWGDKVFITRADENGENGCLLAVDLITGKILWQREHFFGFYKIHKNNSYASVTPTVDAARVYVLWFSEEKSVLSAFTHAGEPVWSSEFDGVFSRHGAGASPVVAGDLVVFSCEQEAVKKGPFVSTWYAVETETGKVRWQLERDMVKSNSQSTPAIMQHNGRSLLVFTSEAHGFSGVNLETGTLVWEFNPFDSRAIASPVFAGDLIIGACKSKLYAIRINTQNEGEVVYSLEHKLSPYVPTPIYKEGLLYNFTDNGHISCHDASTGEMHWREKPAGGFYSSPICIGEKLYGVTRDGEVVVISLGKSYNLLALNFLGEGSHATPVAFNDSIVFRTFSQLICIQGK